MIVLLPLAGWHTQNLRHAWLQCMEVVRIVHASTVYWGHLSSQLFLMPAATSQYFCGRVSKASSPRSPASGPWPYGVHEPFPAICLVRRTLANIYVALVSARAGPAHKCLSGPGKVGTRTFCSTLGMTARTDPNACVKVRQEFCLFQWRGSKCMLRRADSSTH